MGASAKWTRKHCTITIKDASTLSMVAGPGEGNGTVGNIQEDNSEATPTWDRGIFDGFVEGDDQVQDFSLTVKFPAKTLTHASQDRILDAIRRTGKWAAAVTADPAGVKWAPIIQIDLSDGTNTAQIVLPCTRCVGAFAEAPDGTTLTISGQNFKAPTFA